MHGEYRLARIHGGIPSFAVVGVRSTPGGGWDITWSPELEGLRRLWGAAAEAGIRCAADAHARRGGSPQAVEVVSLRELVVDTREDAVFCAAALAAWKSWGHEESEARLMNEAGSWKVDFGPR